MNAAAFRLSRDGRVTPAAFIASPNCDARPPGARIDALVIHAISLPPGCYGGDFIERLFTNRLDPRAHPAFADIADLKVSSHFLVDRAGALVQFVPVSMRSWHAGESKLHGRECVNDFSIGIELEGCDHDRFTAAQYDTLSKLAQLLRARYPAIRPERIVGHSDIAPGRKTDPGPHFDWQRLRALLATPATAATAVTKATNAIDATNATNTTDARATKTAAAPSRA